MKLRGYLTVGLVGMVLVFLDLTQRTVLTALVKLMPGRRDRVLGTWQRRIAHLVLGIVRLVGGARIAPLPEIPGRPGVLVLMNHQSLLDIPLLVASLDDLYPRIVTRARYASGKPLISHMVRLYQYPVVDPRATARDHLLGIEEAARTSQVPLAIYPEGTRTRDGEIGRFKRGGLGRILGARSWDVYLLVADGFWQAARLDEFLASVSSIQGNVTCLGPFPSPAPGEPVDDFVAEMRSHMTSALSGMRGSIAS
ncbi:MAG: lysophospholipid acyltransferase family protein [Gemmatimonadota bacterium]